MASVDELRSAGVTVYHTVKDVLYIRDGSSGFFKGSFGVVYRATRSRNWRFNSTIQAPSITDQLQIVQEIKFLLQFRHPNILELEEAYITISFVHTFNTRITQGRKIFVTTRPLHYCSIKSLDSMVISLWTGSLRHVYQKLNGP
jgi:serine/threonine protein kinase